MTTIGMKLKPWIPPNFAIMEQPPGRRQDGLKQLPCIAVADLPQDTIDGLVAEWLAALYAKAGKPNGWTQGEKENGR